MSRNACLMVIAASLLAGCGGDSGGFAPVTAPPVVIVPAPPAPTPTPTPPPPPTPPVVSVEREIAPATTSAAITTNLTPHIAISPDAAVASQGKLFVMLPGTGGAARNQRLILRTGAARGYHAIGLTYPNDEGGHPAV